MNWAFFRHFPWIDTRARFVSSVPRGGALLDFGASDGETLNHMAKLRPDLRLFAAAHPIFALLPPGEKTYTTRAHWLGWSAYLIA